MYAWFRGEAVPDTKSLARLASVLDLTVAELVEAAGAAAGPDANADAPPALVAEAPAFQPHLLARHSARPMASRQEPSVRGGVHLGAVLPTREVAWCRADDPIGPVARTLYEQHFSQMPVRDGDEWIGLLTTEAIARWMAGRSRHELDVEAKAPVREVLAYADDAGDFRVVPPDVSVGDVVGLFDGAALRGLPLRAVLVAGSRRDTSARGIVTTYDLPHLRRISAGDRSRQR
jgi:predicted transcriptional regulator